MAEEDLMAFSQQWRGLKASADVIVVQSIVAGAQKAKRQNLQMLTLAETGASVAAVASEATCLGAFLAASTAFSIGCSQTKKVNHLLSQ